MKKEKTTKFVFPYIPEENVCEGEYNESELKDMIKWICKPCRELKYCPFGPLVEQFPLPSDRTEKLVKEMSCSDFWHICPVFFCGEGFTETKDYRKSSRNIPRDIMIKVSRRDNNICQLCKINVLDKEIEFDHIIPYSKWWPTTEGNLRVLCRECNRKREKNANEILSERTKNKKLKS